MVNVSATMSDVVCVSGVVEDRRRAKSVCMRPELGGNGRRDAHGKPHQTCRPGDGVCFAEETAAKLPDSTDSENPVLLHLCTDLANRSSFETKTRRESSRLSPLNSSWKYP